MELEKEIQQERFESEYHKMVLNIMFTGHWIERRVARLLKPYDITRQQFNVLRILRGQHPDPATVNTVAERMIDKDSNSSRIVERLRKKGLLERRQCENDRRRVDVSITKAGLDMLKKIDNDHREWIRQFFTINEREANTINTLLDKMRK